jgi:hypothetical protein
MAVDFVPFWAAAPVDIAQAAIKKIVKNRLELGM